MSFFAYLSTFALARLRELEHILVMIQDHIQSTVDRISAGLFLYIGTCLTE